MKVEYRVRPVTRYIVTRFHEDEETRAGGVETKGEFDNQQTAYAVGYALAREEHERLGYPIGDMRIIYPDPAQNAQSESLDQLLSGMTPANVHDGIAA